jgi:hypothetical protein
MIRHINTNPAVSSDVLGKCQENAVVAGVILVAPIRGLLRLMDIARFLLAQLLRRASVGHPASSRRFGTPALASATWMPEPLWSGIAHVSYRRLGKPGSVSLQERF